MSTGKQKTPSRRNVGDESFLEFVLDPLSLLDGIQCRPMFGGAGLYRHEHFFGILFKGRLYFKTDAVTCAAYEEMGMKPFRPSAKQTLKAYYEKGNCRRED